MEHPVPQNVTSFQFHLVGDMTLKQFGYLASGLTLAYLAFLFLFPVNYILTMVIIILTAGAGAAYAFIPILDRPLDHWTKAFFKAVYSPTRGILTLATTKNNQPVNQQLLQNRLNLYLSSISSTPVESRQVIPLTAQPTVQPPSTTAKTPVNQIPSPAKPLDTNLTKPTSPTSQLPSDDELGKLVDMAKEIEVMRAKISQTEQEINRIKNAGINTGAPSSTSEQIKTLSDNLQNLLKETEKLYQQSSQVSNKEIKNTSIKIPPLNYPTKVTVVPTEHLVQKQLILTTFPNVINGVICDSAGNTLEGVIVIIHDTKGLPVRAIKTNKLGQFAGATPLPSGSYKLTLEKEGFEFDTLQIDLTGEIISPIKIFAKDGGSV